MLSVLNIVASWTSQRKDLDLTQAEMAELVGISRTALSHIETGKSVPSPRTLVALQTTLNPLGNPTRLVYPGSALEAAEVVRRVSKSEGTAYALTLDVAAWLLTSYQTPSAVWAYVRPLREWIEALSDSGADQAPPAGRANLVLLRAPDDVLRNTVQIRGFRLAPIWRIVEDGCNLGGRNGLDAARLYHKFPESRRPGLRMDPGTVIKVLEEFGPWM